jgi:methionine synthase II (cobalamin-independent)
MSKVPYDNNALGQFNTVTYKLNPNVYDLSSSEYSSLATLDSSITKFMKFDPKPICGLKTIEELDAFRTGEKLQNLNELVIFDTTRGNYTSTIENTVKE